MTIFLFIANVILCLSSVLYFNGTIPLIAMILFYYSSAILFMVYSIIYQTQRRRLLQYINTLQQVSLALSELHEEELKNAK